MVAPAMPPLIRDLSTFINRWPAMPNVWKRFRVAMTVEEIEEFKAFIKAEGNSTSFVQAIRGIPIEQDPHPTDPVYILERL